MRAKSEKEMLEWAVGWISDLPPENCWPDEDDHAEDREMWEAARAWLAEVSS